MSGRGNVCSGKCPVGKVSFGEVSRRGIVHSGKCPSGKYLLGNCPRGSVSRGTLQSGNCPHTVSDAILQAYTTSKSTRKTQKSQDIIPVFLLLILNRYLPQARGFFRAFCSISESTNRSVFTLDETSMMEHLMKNVRSLKPFEGAF